MLPHDAASTKCSATKTNGFPSSQQPLLSRPEYAPPQFSKAAAKDEFFVCSDSPYQQKEDGLEKPYNPDLPKLANLGTHAYT